MNLTKKNDQVAQISDLFQFYLDKDLKNISKLALIC